MIEAPLGLLDFCRTNEMAAQDRTLNDERALALSFYKGELFGDEAEGRSQLVTRDVAEVVDYMTASVLRTMVSGDRIVEFEARRAEQVEMAQEATETVAWQFQREQNGFAVLHDALKAGLLEKTGVIKTWSEREFGVEWVALTASQLDARSDVLIAEPEPGAFEVDAFGEPEQVYRVKVRTEGELRFRDVAVPNEEFLVASNARSLDDAAYLGHRTARTLSDLVGMGFDPVAVADLSKGTVPVDTLSRARDTGSRHDGDGTAYDTRQSVTLLEEYILWDIDGDGIDERVCVHRVGDRVLSIEEVDEQPFVLWCPFPLPHRLIGQSLADKVVDIQRTRSVFLRQAADSFYLANLPRPLVDEAQAYDSSVIDDLLNPLPGAPIRYKGTPPSIWRMPFVGAEAFQAMEVMAGERESRTGITRLNQGLDADALSKMLCIETPVPLADGGYKLLADIGDGDWIVGSDGMPVRVERAHKIHNPERAYRIRFSSNEEIDAGGEHLWTVQTDNDRRYGKSQTVDTDRLFEMMQGKGRVYIPRVERPHTGCETELPLDPYLLGTWLGDGGSYAPRITTMEPETVEYVSAWAEGHGGLTLDKHQNSGAALSYYVRGLYAPLREMLLLKRGDDRDEGIVGKHIPEEYFRASYRQRLELLRGLMDTDGCHHSKALAVFCQREGRLLDDVIRLIESLGGWPSIKKLSPYGRFDHSKIHYQVFFSLADCPFRLARKSSKWVAPFANASTQVVKAIERIAIKPMRCLTVDAADHLFCVGRRFTVTHNTATGTALMQASGQQMEEYVARQFAECVAELFEKKLRAMVREGATLPVKIDGEFRNVNAGQWSPDMYVAIKVGLGSGRKDQRLAHRMAVLEVQKEALAAGLPIVDMKVLFNSLKALTADAGLGDVTQYFIDPDTLDTQQQPEQPDPAMAAAEARAQLEADRQQFDQRKAEADLTLRAQSAEADVAMKRERHAAEMDTVRGKAELEARLARDKAMEEAGLARDKFAFEREMAERRLQFEIARGVMATEAADLPKNRPGGDLSV